MLRANLIAGLACGAAMEVDLQLAADHRFVCLHDDSLDRETTGSGAILDRTWDELDAMRMRDAAGVPTDERLLFLDEVAASTIRLATEGTEVQLDLKEPAEALDDALLARFAAQIAGHERLFSLSGTDAGALMRMRSVAPGLPVTYSCSDDLKGARSADEFRERFEAVLGLVPEAAMVWVQHRVLTAAYRCGFDLVGFAHERGVAVDTGTIDLDSDVGEEAVELALNAGVDRITTNSPCQMAEFQSR